MTQPQADAAARVQAAADALWERSQPQFVDRADRLDEAVLALVEGGLDQDSRVEAVREAHKLAGTLGMFGLDRAAAASRELEAILGIPGADSTAVLRAAELVEIVVADIRAGRRTAPAVEETEQAPGAGAVVLLVDADADRALDLASAISKVGLVPEVTSGPEAAREAAALISPSAALIDVGAQGLTGNVLDLLEGLRALPEPPAVIVSAAQLTTADRVTAARLGVSAFLDAGASPPLAAQTVVDNLDQTVVSLATVLAVDDDPVILDYLSALLSQEGMRISTLDDPLGFWEALTEVGPDLVLLDIDMPQVDGLELCRLVRADARFATLPVIVLSAHVGGDSLRDAHAAGADDFLTKPLDGADVVARIRSRVARVRTLGAQAATDPLTGLGNEGSLQASFDGLRARVGEDGAIAVASLEVDRAAYLSDHFGQAAQDSALRQFARALQGAVAATDVAVHSQGPEFVVLLPDAGADEAAARLADLVERFAADPLTLGDGTQVELSASGGIAEHPQDGVSLKALRMAAEGALTRARLSGGGRVLTRAQAAQDMAHPTGVDVVVVEDDEVLAMLLQESLNRTGYTSLVIDDGLEAERILAGTTRSMSCRVVLLDLNLPSRSGIEVLRSMREAGVLDQTSVIVISARATEADVLLALNEGAIDHLAKPLSVPILLAKLHRQLGR